MIFFTLLDLRCGECDVIYLYFMCYYVNGSVCLVCLMLVMNCFGETIRNMFGCGCYYFECYGSGECGWRCSVG